MFRTNLHEYDALRNELLQWQEVQHNCILQMYISFGAILIFFAETKDYKILLFTYLFLLPIQCRLNEQVDNVVKISTYIRIFFENNPNKYLYWESSHCFHEYSEDKNLPEFYKHHNRRPFFVISMTSAIQLSAVSTGLIIYYVLLKSQQSFDIFLMYLSISLFLLVCAFNYQYLKRKTDRSQFEDIYLGQHRTMALCV